MALTIRQAASDARRTFRASWPGLLLIHAIFGLLSLVLLGPLLTVLLGWIVLASGDVALTDEDILFFVLSPRGAVLFALVAGFQLTLLVIEQAALMVAAAHAGARTRRGWLEMGRFLAVRFVSIFRLAMRLVIRLALYSLPFLGLIFWIYRKFLGAYDINYFLTHQPAEWWQALVLASVCLLALAWIWVRVLAVFVLALPLVLFQSEAGLSRHLQRARSAAGEWRGTLLRLLLFWFAATVILLAFAGVLLEFGVHAAFGLSGQSLQLLAYLLGVVALFWAVTQFVLTWVSASALGLGLLAVARAIWPELDRTARTPKPETLRTQRFRLHSGALTGVVLTLFVLSGWMVGRVAEQADRDHQTMIIAHRGASAHAPENSLAAVELAIRQGADWVEIDVQQTGDGRIAVIHDGDLMKVAGEPLRVRDATMEQLQAVDIGSRSGAMFADQTVPSLEQVLQRVRDRAGLIIEMKYYGGERGFEEQVARIVEREGVQGQVKFMSLNLNGVRELKSLRPGWQVGLLSSVSVGDIGRFEVDFFAVSTRKATRSFIRQTQRSGRPVYAWTINDPALMSAMVGREVDGIITDYPDVAKRVLEERRELDLHELLIINLASRLGSRFDLPQ